MKKTKWSVVAGLALAFPTGILSGCSGGSGGTGVGVVANPFAGLNAGGVVRNAQNTEIGQLSFKVAAGGTVTDATLVGAGISGNAAAQQARSGISVRGTSTGTGSVDDSGNFTITFNVATVANGNGTVKFTGKLSLNSTTPSASQLVVESALPGFSNATYTLPTLSLTVTNPGGGGGTGGNATVSFSNVSGTNASTAGFNANTATAIVTKVGTKVTLISLTFIETSSSKPRTVTVAIGNGINEVKAGNFNAGNGAAVIYTETDVATQKTRTWGSDSGGFVDLQSLTATEVKVGLGQIAMKASAGPLNTATGTFVLNGSGTGKVQ